MKHLGFLFVLLFVLLGAYFYAAMLDRLIEAAPLEEVTVNTKKKHVFTFHQLYCNNKFGDVTQAGPHLKCLRTDI